MKREEILKAEMIRMSNIICYPIEKLPKIDQHNDKAEPYIYVFEKENLYHYIINERGEEYERNIFVNHEDLLFHVFKNVTFEMAQEYELENRADGEDSRNIIFSKQEDLLSLINECWSESQHIANEKLLS